VFRIRLTDALLSLRRIQVSELSRSVEYSLAQNLGSPLVLSMFTHIEKTERTIIVS
jgi:hypothetical protein